jgi:hypothetical protein
MTGTGGRAARGSLRLRTLALSGVLTAALIVWAALPGRPGAFPRIALICAALAGLAGLGQLALADLPLADDPVRSTAERIIERYGLRLQTIPSPEVMTVAVLVLEVQHPPRAWHTGLLGLALLCYLFATHLAETRTRAAVLWPQLPMLAAGLGLLALAVGAAAVPTLPPGPASAVVRVVAIAAAVAVGVLVVPVLLASRPK